MRQFIILSSFLFSAILQSQPATEIGGALRYRAEGRVNADFDSQLGDEVFFVAQRARLNVRWSLPQQHLSAFVQIQDSRLWGEEGSTTRGLNNTDAHQAYLEVQRLGGKSLHLRIGREKLSFGNERLVGRNDWNNVGRAFDAARFTLGETNQTLNFWLAQIRNKNATGVDSNQEFAGGYFATGRLFSGTAEAYAMVLHDDREFPIGSAGGKALLLYTLGARVEGKFRGRLAYEVEGVYQTGDHGNLKTAAYALALVGRYDFAVASSPFVSASYVFGSGDSNPNDGKQETFSALFPTIHTHLGAMDYASWSNIAALAFGAGAAPSRRLNLNAQLFYFQLAHGNDAWYAAQGFNFDRRNEIFLPAKPGESIELGYELDLMLAYELRERLTMSMGLSRFFAGGFIKAGNPDADDSSWGYLSLEMKL